ncbi:hypothetical protein M569_11829 [Genlisea aurea]|uniref:Essential protein Yae1 N-terminal domain-containing protein n=1 Tax=Genlisea aurea TaxID=192259 RepID=S8DJD0_9LAMI|nr:hypothetical protein M569_11829 [Genlisea aurea]
MDGIEDIFESSVKLEEAHLKEGYEEGYADGLVSGKEEDARRVGLKTGFEIGEELGFYRGCVDVWSSAIRVQPDVFSIRFRRSVKTMDERLRKYPISEPENESATESMDSLRLKFRAMCANLNVKLEYPRAPETGKIEF